MKPRLLSAFAVLALASIVMASSAMAEHFTFPSTNEANRTNGWAHVNVLDDETRGQITLEFVSTRAFYSCFEYRSETDEPIDDTNFNSNAHDLYEYVCVNNETTQLVIEAYDYVEVRMVFGAESDERFDWTRFEVLPLIKEDCSDGGYEDFGFANQGQCLKFVNTGQDSRP